MTIAILIISYFVVAAIAAGIMLEFQIGTDTGSVIAGLAWPVTAVVFAWLCVYALTIKIIRAIKATNRARRAKKVTR